MAGPTPAVVGHHVGEFIREDVEHLIHIAGQLFSAIERQIHTIEAELMFTQSDAPLMSSVTVFKERLIRSATNLDASLQEIAQHLGEGTFTSNEPAHHPRTSFGD